MKQNEEPKNMLWQLFRMETEKTDVPECLDLKMKEYIKMIKK